MLYYSDMNKSLSKLFILLLLLSTLSTTFPRNVYAYVDPGTGSYFLQIVIGVLLGGLFSVKLFWKNVKNIFSRKKK